MATKYQNLSDYNPDTLPNAEILSSQRFGIAVADWNSDITYALLQGAYDTLLKQGVPDSQIDVVHVPGTVELTYAAAKLSKKAYNAIIVIGCVIKGDTPHFDYVCQSVTQGITLLNTQAGVPVVFSVLTTNDKQQAIDRAGGCLGNKGVEGSITAIKMANLLA